MRRKAPGTTREAGVVAVRAHARVAVEEAADERRMAAVEEREEREVNR